MAAFSNSAASATWPATWRTSATVRAVTVTSWGPCLLRSVTITLPRRVAQVSWITRLRFLFASWQARNAASSTSFAGAGISVWIAGQAFTVFDQG